MKRENYLNELMHYTFLKKLSALGYVEAIFLYGSRARKTNLPRSDIDLAINCPDASDAQWQEIINIIDDADTLLHIDYVRYDRLKATSDLKLSIDKDKVLLYRKIYE